MNMSGNGAEIPGESPHEIVGKRAWRQARIGANRHEVRPLHLNTGESETEQRCLIKLSASLIPRMTRQNA